MIKFIGIGYSIEIDLILLKYIYILKKQLTICKSGVTSRATYVSTVH